MDGVLCDSEPYITEAAIRWFKERRNIHVQREEFLPFTGAGEARFVGGVAEKHGVPFDPQTDTHQVYEIYLQIIKGRLHPMAGLKQFLTLCQAQRLPLAIATSADPIKMTGNLREICLPASTFNIMVTGTDVVHRKPDPDIYLLAVQRLGLPAETCLVIEDAINGVLAAKAAGCRCLGLTTSFDAEHLRDAGADWIAKDFTAVPSLIFKDNM
jgi:HAD superfamily hydrolase (TIGR01509 family)